MSRRGNPVESVLSREESDLESLGFGSGRLLGVSGGRSEMEGAWCSSNRSLLEEVTMEAEPGSTGFTCSGLGVGSIIEEGTP